MSVPGRKPQPSKDRERVITVRMPSDLHAAIAKKRTHSQSMNQYIINLVERDISHEPRDHLETTSDASPCPSDVSDGHQETVPTDAPIE